MVPTKDLEIEKENIRIIEEFGEPQEDYFAKKQKILDSFNFKMSQLTKAYPEQEQKTWDSQFSEALAYKADNTTPTPMLTEIADGGDVGVLADKIIAKANYLKVESGKLLAEKNRALKALEDANSNG